MRLIDADELNAIKEKLRIFNSFISTITRQYTDEHQAIYEHWIDCRYDIEDAIDKLSISFDKEKVIAQIQEEKFGKSDETRIALNNAQEYVRKGGVE